MEAVEVARFELLVVYQHRRDGVGIAYLQYLGRRIAVVQVGIGIAEPFGREEFLVVQRNIS
jgi:hypothetical protein